MHDLQTESMPLVRASNLVKYYSIRGGVFHKEIASVKAVDGVSMTIRQGETVGLVGESGCGKTTFGRAILRLEEPTSGEVLFEGENILAYDYNQMRGLRKKMQIIFQDPFSSLNPRKTIAHIVGEPLLVRVPGEVLFAVESDVGDQRRHRRAMPHRHRAIRVARRHRRSS